MPSRPLSTSYWPAKSQDVNSGTATINQAMSPSSPLFLPLSQLKPFCSRLLTLVNNDKISRKELIATEQNLWREVKKLKASQDKASIFSYLIGYYHTILYQLVKLNDADDIFQYHILIRLGDLNRYLDRLDIAEYYYCNARNLFPSYGHAYNQLGLLTRTENFYKCCYYYARAARSVKKPLDKTLAESNLRIVIIEHESSILNQISNDDPSISGAMVGDQSCSLDKEVSLPKTAFDWFYVMVIAIYFDNILPVARPFMQYLGENFSTRSETKARDGFKATTVNCDRDSYLLLACLDMLLDWTRMGKQGNKVCNKVGRELRQVRGSLSSLIASLNSEQGLESTIDPFCSSSSTSMFQTSKPFSGPGHSTPLSPQSLNVSGESSSMSTSGPHSSNARPKLPALPHDCVLKGFKPLESVHEELRFPKELPVFDGSNGKLDEFGSGRILDKGFIGPLQLVQTLSRIRSKIDLLTPMMKLRTRNIALESILSSLSSCDSSQ